MLTKEITILDIISKYPETEDIFRSYDEHAGKCVLCNNLFDTLEKFTAEYDVDLEELILKLKDL